MEDEKFDQLTKTLAGSITRRQVLKGIAGALGAMGLSSLIPQHAMAGGGNSDCAHFCNDVFPPGDERGHCKSDAAHGTGPCAICGPSAPAGHPDVCATGTSGAGCCPAATPTCCNNATCVNLQTDISNCGSCGNVCTAPANATAHCTNGTCTFTCNAGFTLVGSTCCPNGLICMNGGSRVCGCAGGLVCCPGPGGVCTVLGTVANCLSCGDACTAPANATPVCGPTGCSFVCNAGFVQCGSQCVNVTSDVKNCGACGTACAAGEVCQNGHCINVVCPTSGTCGTFPACGATSECVCGITDTGANRCFFPRFCNAVTPCTTTANCPPGEFCLPSTCCPGGTCGLPCPDARASVRPALGDTAGGGLTQAG